MTTEGGLVNDARTDVAAATSEGIGNLNNETVMLLLDPFIDTASDGSMF